MSEKGCQLPGKCWDNKQTDCVNNTALHTRIHVYLGTY